MNPKEDKNKEFNKTSDRKSLYKYLDLKKISEEIYKEMRLHKKYNKKWKSGVRGIKQIELNKFNKKNKVKQTYSQDWYA